MDYEEIQRLQNQKPIKSKKSIQNNRWNNAITESTRYNALSSPELLIIVEIITEHKNIGKLLSVKEIYQIFVEKVGEEKLTERQIRNRLDSLEKSEIIKKVVKSDNMAYTIVEDFNFDNKSLPQSQITVFISTTILCFIVISYSILIENIFDYVLIALFILIFILIQNLAMMIDYEFTANDYWDFFDNKKENFNISKLNEKIQKIKTHFIKNKS